MKERLQKLIAQAGLCSRRRAEEWIAQGKVSVNGGLARLGDSADPETDAILVDGKPLPAAPARTVTVLLYKPRGIVTTLDDEKGRRTVADLLPPALGRLYPVGRLDQFSEGLLLMTNDGDLANRLTHPAGEVNKTYRLWVSGWRDEALDLLRRPIVLDGRPIAPPTVRLLWVKKGSGIRDQGSGDGGRGSFDSGSASAQDDTTVGALDLLRRPIVLDGRPIAPPQVRLLWAKKGSGIRDQGSGDGGRGSFDSGSASAQDDTTVGADITSPARRGGGPASRPVEGCRPPEAEAPEQGPAKAFPLGGRWPEGTDEGTSRQADAAPTQGTVLCVEEPAAGQIRVGKHTENRPLCSFTAALEITIHEGRNRQIRRMAQAAGLTVTRLKRVAEGGLTLGDLKPGEWRRLTEAELAAISAEQ